MELSRNGSGYDSSILVSIPNQFQFTGIISIQILLFCESLFSTCSIIMNHLVIANASCLVVSV